MPLHELAPQITGYLQGIIALYQVLITPLLGIIAVGLTIQLFWYGFEIMTGKSGFHVLDLWSKSFRAMLVISMGLAGGAYAENVIGGVNDFRDGLIGAITGAGAGSTPYDALDQIVGEAAGVIMDQMPWCWDHFSIIPPVNFSGAIAFGCLCVMGLCTVVYAIISAANFMYIEFALAIFYMLGPLALAAVVFQPTARFFDSWLAGVLKYVFTSVVIAAVNMMALTIVRGFALGLAQNAQQGAFVNAAFSAMLGFGVIILLAMRAPSVAADLVGGIGLNLISPAAAAPGLSLGARMGGHMAAGAARMGANAAGYAAGKASQTSAGKAVGAAADRVMNSSPAQKALEIARSAGRLGSTLGNTEKGSVGAAYNVGAGRSVGTGTISGANARPPGRPHDWRD